MIDLTCLHSHDAFYLSATSLDVRGLGLLIRFSLNHSCGVALLVSANVADTKPSLGFKKGNAKGGRGGDR
jgi:hypothetical protein